MSHKLFGVHTNNGWALKQAGNPMPLGTYDTKAEMTAAGKELGQHLAAYSQQTCELRIQNRNVQFSDCRTYGKDNCPPKG